MPALNKGTSTYHSIHGLYWRTSEGALLSVEGNNSRIIPEIWPQLREEICGSERKWSQFQFSSGKQINTLQIQSSILDINNIRSKFPPGWCSEALATQVAEVEHADGSVLGLLTSRPTSLANDAFGTWAEHFILLNTQFLPFSQLSRESKSEHRDIAEQIADVFEARLKNASRDDQWDVCGRKSFLNRVYGFIERNSPVLFCLPAFPCKSPNLNKVGGTMPDLAEHIALNVLRGFVEEINKIYTPGATIWTISDGHVFSDCIGVDDTMVDAYGAELIKLYKEEFPVQEGTVPAIQFKSLTDIFTSNPDSFSVFRESWLATTQVPHAVKTELTATSELCRRLLLGMCEADRGFIRTCIEEQESHALQLYRGQSRFMLEDLTQVATFKALSNKQKKKTAARVAQEMISRNQAYSNLVELLFPNYVRLSIHAHNNEGPKFAIRLLPKSRVRPIDSMQHRTEPVPAYEFQIPTPWHNSIVMVAGEDLMYMAKSKVAKVAMAGPDFEGTWVNGPNGGYFSLRRKTAAATVAQHASIAVGEIVDVFDEKMVPVVVTRSNVNDGELQCEALQELDSFEVGKPWFSFSRLLRSICRFFVIGA